jgi:hypothetical protein
MEGGRKGMTERGEGERCKVESKKVRESEGKGGKGMVRGS